MFVFLVVFQYNVITNTKLGYMLLSMKIKGFCFCVEISFVKGKEIEKIIAIQLDIPKNLQHFSFHFLNNIVYNFLVDNEIDYN